MKLSVYTCSLPEYNIEEAATAIREMGYDGVEWRVDSINNGLAHSEHFKNMPEEQKYAFRYWLDNHATLDVDNIMEECLRAKKASDENGLEICNLATTLRGDDETLEKVLAAAAAIGCKTIRGPLEMYKPDKSYQEQFEDFYNYLRHCEPFLRKYGVKMLIETHHGSMIASASAGMRFLNGLDSECFGLIFDPGNMVYEGFESYQSSFEMLGKYLAHVHIKNAALVPGGKDEFGATKYTQAWKPLKEGSADLAALIKALVKVGYDGWLSVEDFSNEQPTREKLEGNIAYLKQLIAAAEG